MQNQCGLFIKTSNNMGSSLEKHWESWDLNKQL